MPQLVVPVSVGADDGRATKTGSAYPPSATAAIFMTGVQHQARRSFVAGPSYDVWHWLLAFDTSALPDTATITSAALRVVVESRASGDALSFVAGYRDWDTTAASYSHAAETNAHAGTLLTALPGSGTHDFALTNFANISKTGTTKLVGHISQRASDAAPTSLNYLNIYAYEDTGGGSIGARAPRLVIDYTDADTTPPEPPTGLSVTLTTTGD